MKKQKLLMFLVMGLLTLIGFRSVAQTPTYICSLRNDVQVSQTVYEFDVYIQRTGVNVFKLEVQRSQMLPRFRDLRNSLSMI